MSNILLALFLTVFMTGCATTQKSLPQITSKKYSELSEKNIKSNTSASLIEQDIKTTIISESDESHIEEQAIEIEPTGIVYAKTNFSGVLEKAYVQLTIYAYNNPTEPIKLVIGDKEQQKALVWDVEPVKPGYFFLNLRQGDYHITSIAVPVGTTLAAEDIDIRFTVLADKAVYLGSLVIDGIKEKINWGGVPVIKPGFEYQVNIEDQRDQGLSVFKERYPENILETGVQLMQIISEESPDKINIQSVPKK